MMAYWDNSMYYDSFWHEQWLQAQYEGMLYLRSVWMAERLRDLAHLDLIATARKITLWQRHARDNTRWSAERWRSTT